MDETTPVRPRAVIAAVQLPDTTDAQHTASIEELSLQVELADAGTDRQRRAWIAAGHDWDELVRNDTWIDTLAP